MLLIAAEGDATRWREETTRLRGLLSEVEGKVSLAECHASEVIAKVSRPSKRGRSSVRSS